MQQPASNPYEDFQRVFSKFASAEEVTGAAPAEEETAAEEDEKMPVEEEVCARCWSSVEGESKVCMGIERQG